MRLKLITPATELPITLEQAKAQLRVDGNEENDLITGFIEMAVDHVQDVTNRQLMPATYELRLDTLPASIPLPRPPFAYITTITATDENGQEVELVADTDYTTDETNGITYLEGVKGSAWYDNRNSAIVIRYVAGCEEAAKVPAVIKQAIYLLITHFYTNRGDVNRPIPDAVYNLLASKRIPSF